jgi:monoamine oxidase
LPAAKLAAAQAIPLGDALVLVAHLAAPVPQSAWALTVEPVGGFWRTEAGVPRLGGWLKGPTVGQVRGQPADAALIHRLAGAAFPWLATIPITAVQVVDWGADPYARGGYSYPRVGALDQPQQWAAPLDQTLFFAGEATTGFRHPALVHGALESGARAAAEVGGVF